METGSCSVQFYGKDARRALELAIAAVPSNYSTVLEDRSSRNPGSPLRPLRIFATDCPPRGAYDLLVELGPGHGKPILAVENSIERQLAQRLGHDAALEIVLLKWLNVGALKKCRMLFTREQGLKEPGTAAVSHFNFIIQTINFLQLQFTTYGLEIGLRIELMVFCATYLDSWVSGINCSYARTLR